MPSLGFLKKKRTRDGNSDSATSQPTSPVTPTAPKTFGSFEGSLSRSPPSHRPSQISHISQISQSSQAGAVAATADRQQQPQPPQQQQQQQQQPPINPAPGGAQSYTMNQPTHNANASHDQQNLPTINNLINPPQNDGTGNHYSTSPYPATLGAPATNTASASPGTDPNRMLQQQQQVYPQPNMPPSQQVGGDQLSQAQGQPQVQQQQQYQQYPQHPHHQHTMSQPRVTKGKYSLGDFEVLRTLGTGSFGRVHLVQSKHNQRFYAVKVLKKAQVVKMKQVEHTNDERRMLSDVKHPFLITLWGTFQDWKNLYMVMDFVEGGELFSLLRKSGVSTHLKTSFPVHAKYPC